MLINLRNALMTGRRLPYDAEVEFLESTGTQWIDTGIPVSSTIGVRIDFEFANSATEQILFGALDVGVTRYAPFWKGRETFYWTSSTNGSIDGTYGSVDFNRHVILNNFQNDGNAVIDGVIKGTNINRPSAQGPTNFLFARNYSSKYACSCKVYGCKVSVGSLVVRDFIPVRKKTVGYLYDRVSGKLFGNAGTGDFVLGPDVVPVEFIESHGTEWIDTGIVPTTTKTEITFSTPTPPSSGYMCGSFNANNNRYYPAAFSGSSIRYINLINAANTVISQYTNDGNVHTVVYNATGGACYFDGVAAGTLDTTALTASNPIYLFCTSTSTGASGLVSGRIYSCKLYDANDTPVRKFRPVRVGTEGAMMDTLTRRIYRNAGTGAFTFGNDLKYPIPAE